LFLSTTHASSNVASVQTFNKAQNLRTTITSVSVAGSHTSLQARNHSYSAYVEAFTGTHCDHPWKDGQAELCEQLIHPHADGGHPSKY